MQKPTTTAVFAFAAILAAYFYNRHANQKILLAHLNSVLSGLQRAENKVKLSNVDARPRVAVGFGACEDVIVDALEVFAKIEANPPQIPRHMDEIRTKKDLEEVFAYFFRHGAAAE